MDKLIFFMQHWEELSIDNFLDIGRGSIIFDKTGITLIEGINHDSPSSISNGAGKSSIFEALYWVLYGKTKRGLTGDAIINRTTKKDCKVELIFDDFKVIRTRKHAELGTGLWLYQKNDDTWDDLTKGTVKESQKLLEDIIKISDLTFSKIAYFGQGDVKAFASLTDSELKRVFEQALGLTFLSDHLSKVKSHKGDLRVDIISKETSISNLTKDADLTKEKIEYLTKAIKDLEAKKLEEKKCYDAEIESETINLKAIEESHATTKKAIAKQAETIKDRQARLRKLEDLRKQLQEKYDAKRELLYRQKAMNEMHLKETNAQIEKIKKAPEKIGKDCDECGREFSSEDIEKAISQMGVNLTDKRKTSAASKLTIKDLQAAVDKLKDLFDPLEKEITGLLEVKAEAAELQAQKRSLEEMQRRGHEIKKRILRTQKLLKTLEEDEPDFEPDIHEQYKKLSEIEKAIDETRAILASIQDDFQTAAALEEILGNGGLKSYIFDNITPELNKTIDKYIKLLDDIDIEISTVTKLKSGDYREKFSIKVDNRHGASQYAGNSGGEQQKVNLAVALGFNRILRDMSEGAINAIFLDEPFESLDEGSSESVIDLCRTFADIGNVFVITHQQGIKDLIADTIIAEKKGGIATIR